MYVKFVPETTITQRHEEIRLLLFLLIVIKNVHCYALHSARNITNFY